MSVSAMSIGFCRMLDGRGEKKYGVLGGGPMSVFGHSRGVPI